MITSLVCLFLCLHILLSNSTLTNTNYLPVVMYRSNWLDFSGWSSQGLPIRSTSSSEAVKLYDAAVSQSIAWYDDPVMGGLKNTVARMNEADPDFILGNAFALSSQLLGFVDTYYDNPSIQSRIDSLVRQAETRKEQITRREYLHVQAALKLSQMDWDGAADLWEEILLDHPTDCHALKTAFFVRLLSGNPAAQFAMIERSYGRFQERPGAIHGALMHAYYGFALQEASRYKEAQVLARKSLEANPWDGWATHTMAHTFEMTGHFEEGLAFMSERATHWSQANHLSCHNYWHHSLFNLATGDFDGAIDLFDSQITKRMRATQTAFSTVDASSLLTRLLFVEPANRTYTGESIQDRFKDVFTVAKQYMEKHVLGFTNVHFIMAALGSGSKLEATELMDGMAHSKLAELHPETAVVTRKVMSALTDFHREQYEKATETLSSIKDSTWRLGGSNAQRDIINQLHLVCALKSTKAEHKKLLNQLVQERESFEANDRYLLRKV